MGTAKSDLINAAQFRNAITLVIWFTLMSAGSAFSARER